MNPNGKGSAGVMGDISPMPQPIATALSGRSASEMESDVPLRIFYLSQRVPFPPNRGDKIATYNQVRFLSRRHDVEVFCLADAEDENINAEILGQRVKAVHAVPLSHFRARFRTVVGIFGGRPLTLAYLDEKRLRQVLEDRRCNAPPDVVIVYSSSMAQFVESWHGVERIMQFADVDSMKWREYARRAAHPARWLYRIEAKRLAAYERHLATSFSRSVLCTEAERRDLELAVPGLQASCVYNGVDLEYFKPVDVRKQPGTLVFTGVMNYYPNIDGVIWFCQEILPLVRRVYPGVRFTICGSHPTRVVRALAKLPGVAVTGRVADVRDYLSIAEIGVVPLRVARGVQNKLLEAMAMGLPCVSTPVATAGIRALEGRDLLAAQSATDFANQVVRLLQDSELRQKVGAAARRAVESGHSWQAQMIELERVLRETLRDRKLTRALQKRRSESSRLAPAGNAASIESDGSVVFRE